MRRLAVIPARGGSKRIPKKNIKNFNGKPVITYSISAALGSGLFDSVVVSTDDPEICMLGIESGAEAPFIRPANLSGDFVGVFPVLQHAYEFFQNLGQSFDQVWLISACAPLLLSEHLRGAAEQFDLSERSGLLAVGSYPAPVEWAFHFDNSSRLVPVNSGAFSIRSQDLAPSFYDTGMFSAFTAERIRGDTADSGDLDFVGYQLGREYCVDIDDYEDWCLAELMYQARFKKG